MPISESFVFMVMARVSANVLRCFSYSFVPINQLCMRLELFAKQNAATSRNGVVGRMGSTTPTAPRAVLRMPSTRYTSFIISAVLLLQTFFLFDSFHHMPHSHHRVMQQHARAGIAHHLAYSLAHLRLVAMRFAV